MWLLRSCRWPLLLLLLFATLVASEVNVHRDLLQGLVVSISPRVRVAEHREKEFLTSLKAVLELLSYSLSISVGYRIENVVIVIPSEWQTKSDLSNILKVHEDADIVIESGHGVFQNNPFTIQPQGCFRAGRRVVVPETFVIGETNKNNLKGKRLLQEWVQYRYGVFKEHGFLNDDFYPLYYAIPGMTNKTLFTKCNEGLDFTLRTVNGDFCSPDFDPNTGRENKEEYCHYSYSNAPESVYSIMSHPLFDTIKQFCGKELIYHHNTEAPSKQNALCQERDIYSVLSKHRDYIEIRQLQIPKVPLRPNFFVHRVDPLRIVLAIDDSKYMNLALVLTYIRIFIQHDIVTSSKLDLLLFHANNTDRKFDLLEEGKRLSDLSNEDTTVPACLRCAIEEGMNMLGDLGVLVVVGSLESITDKVKTIDSKSVKVFLILFYYSSDTNSSQQQGLDSWAQKSGGQLFVIYDNMQDNIISPGTHFYQIFNYIAQLMTPVKNVTIHHEEIMGTGERTAIIFHVPKFLKSIQIKFTDLYFYTYDEMTLNRPNGTVALDRFYFRFQSTTEHEAGKWSLDIKTQKDKKFHILVTGQSSDDNEAISIQTWVDSSQKSTVNIYAEIHQGIHPVVADKVKAFIYCDAMFIQTIYLVDDGVGYPDITARDGIYSAALNLTDFDVSYRYCTLVIKAEFSEHSKVIKGQENRPGQEQLPFGDTNCCGSKVPAIGEMSLGVFYLHALPVTFTLPVIEALAPIGSISNLRVYQVDHQRAEVKLSWTDPFTSSDLVSYVIKCSMDRNLLKTNFDDINNTVVSDVFKTGEKPFPQFQRYGYPQTIAILINEVYLTVDPNWFKPHHPLFFAIKVKTHDDRLGPLSNIVVAYVDPTLPVTEEPTTTNNSTTDGNINSAGLSQQTIIIIVVVCSVFFVFIICLLVFICCFVKRRRRRLEETEDETSSTYKSADLPIHTISNGTLDSKNIVNPVNPIGSWPAGVLMDHYGKVQEAKSKRVDPPIISTEQLIENLSNIHHGTPSINSTSASDFSSDNDSQGSHSSRRVTQV